jgi:hypothetical protein
MRTLRLLLPGALLLLTACGDDARLPFSADPLQGCFATGARKPADFRIDKEGGQYFVSFSRGASGSANRTPCTRPPAARSAATSAMTPTRSTVP